LSLLDFLSKVVIYFICQFFSKGSHLLLGDVLRHFALPDETMELISNFQVKVHIAQIFKVLSSSRTHIGRQIARPKKVSWNDIVIELLKLLKCATDGNSALFLITFAQLVLLLNHS
jgi:hypothetical protein